MAPLNYGLNIALTAVLAHQQAIQVVEHNVANANTPGYRRQQANLVPGPPYAPPSVHRTTSVGQTGGGVQVESIKRFTLEFFDTRLRGELASASGWETQRDMLKQVESTLAETTADGLTNKLDAFWAGWQKLSTDPANVAVRNELLQQSQSLVDAVHRRAEAFVALRRDQDLSIQQRVTDINEAASQVASLNMQIAHVLSVGDQPNDLMDERDRQLDKLSELAGAYSHTSPNGEVSVSIGGHALVVGSDTFALQAQPNAANSNLVDVTWSDGQALNVQHGEVAGLLYARDTVVPSLQQGLDNLASQLVTQVNALHTTGFGTDGVSGRDFLTGVDAMSFAISSDITGTDAIAAAATNGGPGDGEMARQLAELKNANVAGLNGTTFGGYYNLQVGHLGLEVKNAVNGAADRRLVADSLENQRQSVSGVSLDEEAARLVQSQRAYEAAMRLVTTVDQMMDRVINGMGVVGR